MTKFMHVESAWLVHTMHTHTHTHTHTHKHTHIQTDIHTHIQDDCCDTTRSTFEISHSPLNPWVPWALPLLPSSKI